MNESIWNRLRGLPAETQRRYLRRVFRQNPWLFLRSCLYPDRRFQPFHQDWLELLTDNSRSLLLAPRGFFKTTTATVGLLAHRAFFHPEAAHLLVSATGRQARLILTELRAVLSNDEVAWLGEGSPFQRATRSGLWLHRRSHRKEPSIAALGSGQGLVGRHHDGIVGDDLVGLRTATTPRTRQRLESWFTNVLTPTLLPGGFLHLVGTRHHPRDLYDGLLRRGIATNSDTRSAIKPDGEPLFPERWSAAKLEERRTELGPIAFALQYQNDTGPADGSFFKPEWLHQRIGELPPFATTVMGVDLALGGADYLAAVVLGIASDGDWYVIEAPRARLDFSAQLELLARLARQHRPSVIGIETVAYQLAAVQEMRRRFRLPVIALRPRGGKLLRAQSLAAWLAAGRLWLPPTPGPLTDELLAFPHGQHDDLTDALGYACELAAGRGISHTTFRVDDQDDFAQDDPLAKALGI